MQVIFNVPPALQRDLEWLAAQQGSSVEALLYITAFQGFVKELERKVTEKQQREEAAKPYREPPMPIDWHKKDKPSPMKWPTKERRIGAQ